MLRDRKREEKKLKSVVPRNEDADVIPLLRDLRFMNHIVSGAAARDDEPYERTDRRRSAWCPVSSMADPAWYSAAVREHNWTPTGDAPPRIAKTRNYSLINCQRSMWPYA
jgi:hypothetical protein